MSRALRWTCVLSLPLLCSASGSVRVVPGECATKDAHCVTLAAISTRLNIGECPENTPNTIAVRNAVGIIVGSATTACEGNNLRATLPRGLSPGAYTLREHSG